MVSANEKFDVFFIKLTKSGIYNTDNVNHLCLIVEQRKDTVTPDLQKRWTPTPCTLPNVCIFKISFKT